MLTLILAPRTCTRDENEEVRFLTPPSGSEEGGSSLAVDDMMGSELGIRDSNGGRVRGG